MVICIVALIVLSILSIFSAKYRQSARDAFKCVFKMIQFKPCDVQLEQKIKSKVTSKLMFMPSMARFFYKNFKVLSWIFTIIFFVSLGYTVYSIYNLIVYGSCEPGEFCVITWIGVCILDLEKYILYAALIIIAIILLYLFIKKSKKKY